MANPKQPINILLATGRSHLTQAEIEARRAEEPPPAPADNVKPPEYLSAKQREEFCALVKQLLAIGDIFGNVDAGELGRYVVAHSMYARYTKLLRTLPKKKRARLRELRERLSAEEGRFTSKNEDMDDEDVALELEKSLTQLQDKFFNQCETTARALGLNITSRCKLVVPKAAPETKTNKFDTFKKRVGAG